MNGSPSECVHNCFHVRQIINQKIRVMLCKIMPGPSACCDRNRARAERFPAGDVARRVTYNVDLGGGELRSRALLFRARASKSTKLVSVAVIIGKRAEFKKMPDAVVFKLQSRSAGHISREQGQNHMWPCFQSLE